MFLKPARPEVPVQGIPACFSLGEPWWEFGHRPFWFHCFQKRHSRRRLTRGEKNQDKEETSRPLAGGFHRNTGWASIWQRFLHRWSPWRGGRRGFSRSLPGGKRRCTGEDPTCNGSRIRTGAEEPSEGRVVEREAPQARSGWKPAELIGRCRRRAGRRLAASECGTCCREWERGGGADSQGRWRRL